MSDSEEEIRVPKKSKKGKGLKLMEESNQTAEERRALRQELRNQNEHVREKKKELIENKSAFLSTLDDEDKIHEKIAWPREAVLEGETMVILSEIGKAQATKIATDVDVIDTRAFIKDLKLKYNDANGDFDFQKLGSETGGLFRCVPRFSLLVSPFQQKPIPKKTKKAAERKSGPPTGQVATLQETTEKDAKENVKGQQPKRIANMAKILKEKKVGGKDAIPLANLVLNPESFSQTVENTFDYSVLMYTAKCVDITRGKDGPIIHYRKENDQTGNAEGIDEKKNKKSAIMRFNIDDFNAMKEFATEQLIKNREAGADKRRFNELHKKRKRGSDATDSDLEE